MIVARCDNHTDIPHTCPALGGRLRIDWHDIPMSMADPTPLLTHWYRDGVEYRWGRAFTIYHTRDYLCVAYEPPDDCAEAWTVHFGPFAANELMLYEGNFVASKWIAQAIRHAEGATAVAASVDPFLSKDRPAITEFLTELESSPGVPRETSILMVTVSDDGIRVGLKDTDAGGWLWREAKTVAKALDEIEKALQSGNPKWSIPGRKQPVKKK